MEKQKIRAYDLEGNFLEDFDSITEAANKLGIVSNRITSYLWSSGERCDIYQFKYLTSKTPYKISEVSLKQDRNDTIKVSKSYNGKVVSVYNSIIEASEKTGINRGSISNSIKNGHKAAIFEFKEIK